jgi:hypothetical protein
VFGDRKTTDSLRCVWVMALHVLGFGSFFTRHNVENDSLTFIQRLETSPCNRRMMYEHVWPTFLHDEAESMLIIEPLYFTTRHSIPLPSS